MKMKQKQNSLNHMYKKTLKKTLLVQALSAALGATVLMAGVSTTAWAQSNTTGTVSGNVGVAANSTVSLENTQTGIRRTVTPDATGRFQATALPPGEYKVQLLRGGAVVGTRTIEVLAGAGAEANFVAAGSQTVESVQVTATRQVIDVSTANSGSTFTAKELASLPIAPSVSAIVQLAPGTTKGDYRYGNNANSFGGAGASENSAYINGFPVTNGLYQVGFSSLPFGSIAQAQIITGGYSAEFGRATGGVINLTTKSGTNDFEMSAGYTVAPNRTRSKAKDIMYPVTGSANNAATDGRLLVYKSGDKRDEQTWNLSLAGPIIKDKLFFYYAAEETRFQKQGARLSTASSTLGTTGWLDESSTAPRSTGRRGRCLLPRRSRPTRTP